MKTLLRAGALRAPENVLPSKIEWLKRMGFRQLAGGVAALILVIGAAGSSAAFVDYLADRAKLRAYAAATEKPAEQVKRLPEKTMPPAPVKVAALPTRERPATQDAAAITKEAKAAAAGQKLPNETATRMAAAGSLSPAEAAAVPPTEKAMAALKPQLEGKLGPTLTAGYVGPRDETYTGAIATPLPLAYAPVAATGVTQPSTDNQEETSVRTAKVKEHVNLRSKPADESKVLTVVPAKASVNVLSCKSWCEVEYAGTKGFIYKRFIGNS